MCKIAHKALTIVTIVIALALAVAATVWHEQGLNYMLFVSRFFDVLLPILAVGALLKYLFGCHHVSYTCNDKTPCSCNKDNACTICGNEECTCNMGVKAKTKTVAPLKKKVRNTKLK